MGVLDGKTIVFGVTGGIAAYKSCEAVSRLKKLGATVCVIMTKNATEFVAPMTFETLSNQPCVVDTFARPERWEVEHVSLAKRADRRITHAVAVEGVVDSPRRERGVERFDPHAVVILGDVPFEVGQRPDRIAEKVGFERFFDALLLGRVDGLLRLPLLVFGRGVRYSVEVGVFAALLGSHE